MTWVCPDGHSSEASDYCDVCGLRIAAPASDEEAPGAVSTPPDAAAPSAPADDDADTSTTAPSEPCPRCGTARSGDDRFCEVCGHDFRQSPTGDVRWEAVVHCDRAQFERIAAPGIDFPVDVPERRLVLDGERLRIGRAQRQSDGSSPEIVVADPVVSRLHAVLERCADGSYGVRDLGSTNGTVVGDDTLVGEDTAVTLADGDVIHIGAWTAITVRVR